MLIISNSPKSKSKSKSAFLQAKATDHVETMMITVNEANSKETKIPNEFILVLLPHLIHNRGKCKLYGCIGVCKRTIAPLFLHFS